MTTLPESYISMNQAFVDDYNAKIEKARKDFKEAEAKVQRLKNELDEAQDELTTYNNELYKLSQSADNHVLCAAIVYFITNMGLKETPKVFEITIDEDNITTKIHLGPKNYQYSFSKSYLEDDPKLHTDDFSKFILLANTNYYVILCNYVSNYYAALFPSIYDNSYIIKQGPKSKQLIFDSHGIAKRVAKACDDRMNDPYKAEIKIISIKNISKLKAYRVHAENKRDNSDLVTAYILEE